MRATAIAPLVCAFSAFVLSILALFAGDSASTLTSVYMFRLNTGSLGEITPFEEDEADEDDGGGFLSDPLDTVTDKAKEVGNDAASAVGGAAGDALGLEDFYQAHLMTYCSGDLKPDPEDPNAEAETKFCSERKAFFSFDLEGILEEKGIPVDSIELPEEASAGLKALGIASKAMYFFFILGIACAGLGAIGAAFGILAYEHLVALANLALSITGAICLTLAAAIASVVIIKASDVINDKGDAIGLKAEKGRIFLGMTWAAALLMVVASLAWVGEFFMGRRSRSYEKEYY